MDESESKKPGLSRRNFLKQTGALAASTVVPVGGVAKLAGGGALAGGLVPNKVVPFLLGSFAFLSENKTDYSKFDTFFDHIVKVLQGNSEYTEHRIKDIIPVLNPERWAPDDIKISYIFDPSNFDLILSAARMDAREFDLMDTYVDEHYMVQECVYEQWDDLLKAASEHMPGVGTYDELMHKSIAQIYDEVIAPTIKSELDRIFPVFLSNHNSWPGEVFSELPREQQGWLKDAYPQHVDKIDRHVQDYKGRVFHPDNYAFTRVAEEDGVQTYEIRFKDGHPLRGHMENFIGDSFGALPFVQDGLVLEGVEDDGKAWHLKTSVRSLQIVLDKMSTNRRQYGEIDIPEIS